MGSPDYRGITYRTDPIGEATRPRVALPIVIVRPPMEALRPYRSLSLPFPRAVHSHPFPCLSRGPPFGGYVRTLHPVYFPYVGALSGQGTIQATHNRPSIIYRRCNPYPTDPIPYVNKRV